MWHGVAASVHCASPRRRRRNQNVHWMFVVVAVGRVGSGLWWEWMQRGRSGVGWHVSAAGHWRWTDIAVFVVVIV